MKNIIVILVVVIALGFGYYFIFQNDSNSVATENDVENTSELQDNEEVSNEEQDQNNDQDEQDQEQTQWSRQSVIGQSVEGKNIVAYQYGLGENEILFVGGIHGGYSWNTAAVAYDLINYLEGNNEAVPENVQVTVVPVLNPDGLSKVVSVDGDFSVQDVTGSESVKVSARFNANNVDLNRNFDCDWQSTAKWQNKDVDGGDSVFSEPESVAIRNYVNSNNPDAVVVWYSSGGGVFSSSCHNGVLEETSNLTDLYANAAGYKSYDSFDFYATTGDMVNWLAKEGIPAISVLLTTHQDPEWNKNREGIEALLEYYNQ